MAIVRQTSQWICGCLLSEFILNPALFGDVLNNNFIAIPLAFRGIDFASAQADGGSTVTGVGSAQTSAMLANASLGGLPLVTTMAYLVFGSSG